MKGLVLPVIGVALVMGLVGAMTAYSPPLSLPDERLVGLTLNAPAGLKLAEDGTRGPLARANERLTPELLAALRAGGEKRVKVKEFDAARWTGMPWFIAGCAGLLLGAWLARRAARAAVREADAASTATGSSAETALEAMRHSVDRLRAELPALAGAAPRLRRIQDDLAVVQETHVPAFVAARPLLLARLGMAGFARLMDRFAAGERQVNRAWSAACDGYLDEANECLDNASALLAEARERLGG